LLIVSHVTTNQSTTA